MKLVWSKNELGLRLSDDSLVVDPMKVTSRLFRI